MNGFRKMQTVRRCSGGHYDDDGMWNPGACEEFQILASVQPLGENVAGQYTQMRPNGAVAFNAVRIYSDTPLRAERQETAESPMQEADVLVWRGRLWKVVAVMEWQSGVISHYRMIAWEVEPDAGGDEEVSP